MQYKRNKLTKIQLADNILKIKKSEQYQRKNFFFPKRNRINIVTFGIHRKQVYNMIQNNMKECFDTTDFMQLILSVYHNDKF